MTNAICTELGDKKTYLQNEPIKTIYFGGGTPSVLPISELKQIVETVYSVFAVDSNVEFTFECNPDDLTHQKLTDLKHAGVNRLSIGIQSFDNDQLIFMNRAHNAIEADTCVKIAQEHGFNNITIDLIYGLPNSDSIYWKEQVKKAIQLDVNHISAYCLTIEPKTVFGNWHKKGKLTAIADENSLDQFKLLQDELRLAGFEHYEISNFSKKGFISKHNSAYWLGEKYIGVGPSAHSYNGQSRQWNVAHNIKYIKALESKSDYFEVEQLTKKNQFNEFILTRLRTKWGVDLIDLFKIYSNNKKETLNIITKFVKNGDLNNESDCITLTQQGKFIVDHISSELFI